MPRRRVAEIIEGRDPIIFSRNIKRARESLGWTRQRLCQEAGVSPQTLKKIEDGEGCSLLVEKKLATVLGTVVGRLWERQELPRCLVRRPETDRWYFAGPEDGESFWRRHGITDEAEMRFDPDAIQDPEERSRMGWGGLVAGFVRVTTAHLQAGTIISSVIEVYRTLESEFPPGKLVYFYAMRGALCFRTGDEVHDLPEGGAIQAEMEGLTQIDPAEPVEPGMLPPVMIYVDVTARLNPSGGSNNPRSR